MKTFKGIKPGDIVNFIHPVLKDGMEATIKRTGVASLCYEKHILIKSPKHGRWAGVFLGCDKETYISHRTP